jgi:type I restriction enzyme S subunit
MSEWKTYQLGDLIDLKSGKSRPKEIGEYPVYGGNGILDYTNQFNVSDETIIIGRVGAYCGSVYFENKKIWISDNALFAKPREGNNAKFLYYYLKDKNLNRFAGGSSHPLLTQGQLNEIEVEVPNEKTQQRIASILSSLDDAIELNQQINKTLEEMAKAIFKEWFVDFNYPNATGKFQETEIGKIPVGWKLGKLNEVLEIKYGKDHKHLESGEIPVYGSGGIMRYADKALYEFESILIPRKGTLSNLFYINKPFWSVDTMFYTKFKLANSGKYLFHLLQSLNLATMNVGSAVPSLTTEVLNNILIAIPTTEVLLKFEEVVSSLFEQIEQNIEENQSLINLRDTLLPKLMKGEININL